MATIDPSSFEAVNNANYKSVAEAGVLSALGHSNRLNIIAESSLGQILKNMNELDPAQAASISGVVSSDLAEKLGELSGAVANAQQLFKGAQTTHPVSARPTE